MTIFFSKLLVTVILLISAGTASALPIYNDPTTGQDNGSEGEYQGPPAPDEYQGQPAPDEYQGQPAGNSSNKKVTLFDPIDKSLVEIFEAILDIIMVFAVPIILFFIVWAGFLYVTAGGNQEKISQATKALLYAVIGAVIVLGAKALLAVITNTINVFK